MQSHHVRRGLHRRLPPWMSPTGSNAPSQDPQPTDDPAPPAETTTSSSSASTQPTSTPQPTSSSSSSDTPTTSPTPTTSQTSSPAPNTQPAPTNAQSSTSPSSSSSSSSSASSSPSVIQNIETTRATPSATNVVPVGQSNTPASIRVTSTISKLPASGSASPSATAAPASTVNTGLVAGVVGAVIVGIAVIIFVTTWFMRRSRRKDEYNPDDFRRQSTMLPDPDHDGPTMRGMTPRPPSMIQQHLDGPVSYGAQQPYGNSYHDANGYPNQMFFAPGQVMHAPQPISPQTWSPVTPGTAQPFFHAIGGIETPLGSPVSVQPYDSAYDAHGNLVRSHSTGPNTYLTRQPSMNTEINSTADTFAPPEAHYVDLSRSSVSPFQAAQYAEISHHLNTAPPVPLPTPVVTAAADEVLAKAEPVIPDVADPKPLNVPQYAARSPFVDPHSIAMNEEEDNVLPQPPSPVYSNKSRIDSTPPTLPEQRVFSPVKLEFPNSVKAQGPSPLSAAPVTEVPAQPQPATLRPQKDAPGARPDTVYTLYDDDDAYAAI